MSPVVWAGGCLPKKTGEGEDVLRSPILGTGCSDHPLYCSNLGSEIDSELSHMVEAGGL